MIFVRASQMFVSRPATTVVIIPGFILILFIVTFGVIFATIDHSDAARAVRPRRTLRLPRARGCVTASAVVIVAHRGARGGARRAVLVGRPTLSGR